jgi:hypothetical protein
MGFGSLRGKMVNSGGYGGIFGISRVTGVSWCKKTGPYAKFGKNLGGFGGIF